VAAEWGQNDQSAYYHVTGFIPQQTGSVCALQ